MSVFEGKRNEGRSQRMAFSQPLYNIFSTYSLSTSQFSFFLLVSTPTVNVRTDYIA